MAILALELWVGEMAARLCQQKFLFLFVNGSSIASWQRCHFWPPSPLGNSEGIIIGKREAVARPKKGGGGELTWPVWQERRWIYLYTLSAAPKKKKSEKALVGIMPCYGDPCGHYHYYYWASRLPPANLLDHANDFFCGFCGSVFNCRVERKHLPCGRGGINLWSKKGFFNPYTGFPPIKRINLTDNFLGRQDTPVGNSFSLAPFRS